MKRVIVFEETVRELICHACKQKIQVKDSDQGQMILHKPPYCESFCEEEASFYIKKCLEVSN